MQYGALIKALLEAFSGPAGVTDLIDNYGSIRSTGDVGVRLGNPEHVLTTLNNQYGATIQGCGKRSI